MKPLRAVEVCNACRKLTIVPENICDLFQKLDRCQGFHLEKGDLSLAFVSKKKIKEIHRQFLGDFSLTDVITFRGDRDLNFAGEIILCPVYARDQSKIYGTTFEEEVKLYLVHGYLHLCGLKDKTEKEAQEMRAAEIFCMNFLKNFVLQVFLKN
ncbi:MAG: rRNA maturation RNase YbeY [Puniceicoccales bacterium]|nr:rRNA maturation RNase YbeY [Puniceicoccales bacterium]